MDFQRDIISEEAIINIYNGIEQNIPEYVYCHSVYTDIFLKMILEIRDIQNGYGQEQRAYTLLYKWISQCPLHFQQMAEDQAIHILQKMCFHYGCWKDIRQICLLFSAFEKSTNAGGHKGEPHLRTVGSPIRNQFFIKRALQLMNDNLYTNQPNVAKWIPREGQIPYYDYLATDYVERFLQIETASTERTRQLYKNVVKNRQTDAKKMATPIGQPKTKRTLQEAETALIEKALLLSKEDPSATTEQMAEEDRIEQEWLKMIEHYEPIENATFILDTPLFFTTQKENLNRIKTVCRFLYKMTLPSRKRIYITTSPEPIWMNLMGKNLVETIRLIVKYTEINDNTTEKSQMNGMAQLIKHLVACEIPPVEMEKMTWIIMSNFSQKLHSGVHLDITNLFLHKCIPQQNIPNLVYIRTSTTDQQKQPQISFSTYCSSITIRTFWSECSSEIGISNNHWKHISKITQDAFVRQFTPFQNVVNIVSTNITLL